MARAGRSFPAKVIRSHALFSDHLIEDFDIADVGTIVGAATDLRWGVVQGTVAVVSNEASATATGPNRARAEHLLNSFDMWAEARGTNTLEDVANQNVNLALRVSAGDNSQIDMYVCQFRFQANNVVFQRTVDGTSTPLSTSGAVTLVAGTYYTFRFEVTGDINNAALVAKVDGVTVHTFTDTGAVAAGFQPDLFAGFALQEPSTGFSKIEGWEAGTDFTAAPTTAPPAQGRIHGRATAQQTGIRSAIGRTHVRAKAQQTAVRLAVGRTKLRATAKAVPAASAQARVHVRSKAVGFLVAPPAIGRVHIRGTAQQTAVRTATGRIHGRATASAHPNATATGRIHLRARAIGGVPSSTQGAAAIGRFHLRATAVAHPNVAATSRFHLRARAVGVPTISAKARVHLRAKAQQTAVRPAVGRTHVRARALAHPNVAGSGRLRLRSVAFGAVPSVGVDSFDAMVAHGVLAKWKTGIPESKWLVIAPSGKWKNGQAQPKWEANGPTRRWRDALRSGSR